MRIWNIFKLYLLLMILSGVLYPLLITLIGILGMHDRSVGNIIVRDQKEIGALLIAQKFTQDKYFWPRPSATDYNPLPSGGSNLGPTSKELKQLVEDRRAKIMKAHETTDPKLVPSELLFASGSGLDPHISVETAYYQASRVIKARGWEKEEGFNRVDAIIRKNTQKRVFGFIGSPYVNVLLLNLDLDTLENTAKKKS